MEEVIVNIYVIEFQYLCRIKAFRLDYLEIGNQWSRHLFINTLKQEFLGEKFIYALQILAALRFCPTRCSCI